MLISLTVGATRQAGGYQPALRLLLGGVLLSLPLTVCVQRAIDESSRLTSRAQEPDHQLLIEVEEVRGSCPCWRRTDGLVNTLRPGASERQAIHGAQAIEQLGVLVKRDRVLILTHVQLKNPTTSPLATTVVRVTYPVIHPIAITHAQPAPSFRSSAPSARRTARAASSAPWSSSLGAR